MLAKSPQLIGLSWENWPCPSWPIYWAEQKQSSHIMMHLRICSFEATLYNFPLVVSNGNSTLKLKHLNPILSKQSSWNDCYYELLVRELCMAKPFSPQKNIACILACTCPSLVALQLTRPHHSVESFGWRVQLSIPRRGWSCNEQNASKCCWIWL